MELSGSIQVIKVEQPTCRPGTYDLSTSTIGDEYRSLGFQVPPARARALFEAEVLRIKEAPHGTDAE